MGKTKTSAKTTNSAEVLSASPVSKKGSMSRSVSISWSAPIPPPEIFKQYPKEVQEAIIRQADQQMQHRHSMEKKVLTSHAINSKLGMSYAFIITLAFMVSGVVLLAMGRDIAGLVAVFGPASFQGGNILIQKWKESQDVADRAGDLGSKSKKK